MRRFAVLLSVAAFMLLGVSAFGAHPAPVTQEASPAASPTALPPLLQRWLAALATGDGEAVAALFTTEGVYEDVPSGSVARGHGQIAALINRIVAQERDFQLRLRAVHLTDDGAVLEYTVHRDCHRHREWANAVHAGRYHSRGRWRSHPAQCRLLQRHG